MNMDPYFTTINYPLEKASHDVDGSVRIFKSARYGSDFFTGMLMAEYGHHLRAGRPASWPRVRRLMVMPATYGGMRVEHLFPSVPRTTGG